MFDSVGDWLLDTVRKTEPDANMEAIMNLELNCDEALMWIITFTLKYLWERRTKGRVAQLDDCVAKMTSDLLALQKTDKFNVATIALIHIST